MGYYKIFLTKSTFVYALEHGNEVFIKQSLLSNAFEAQDIKDDEVVAATLTFFEQQASMNNFYLNVLVLS